MEYNPAYIVVFLFGVLGFFQIWKECCTQNEMSSTTHPSAAQQPTNDDLSDEERRMERRFLILISIIHRVSTVHIYTIITMCQFIRRLIKIILLYL